MRKTTLSVLEEFTVFILVASIVYAIFCSISANICIVQQPVNNLHGL